MNDSFFELFLDTTFAIQFALGLVMISILFYSPTSKNKMFSVYVRLGYVFVVSLIGIYLYMTHSSMVLEYLIFYPLITGFYSLLSLIKCVVYRVKKKELSLLSKDIVVTILMLLPAFFVWLRIMTSGKWFGG